MQTYIPMVSPILLMSIYNCSWRDRRIEQDNCFIIQQTDNTSKKNQDKFQELTWISYRAPFVIYISQDICWVLSTDIESIITIQFVE